MARQKSGRVQALRDIKDCVLKYVTYDNVGQPEIWTVTPSSLLLSNAVELNKVLNIK